MTLALEPDEIALILGRCAHGERDALRQLFDAEGARLNALALRILRRPELAEEAVQDAFVQIWTKATQYDPDRGNARGWITAIVRNRAITILRDGTREEPAEEGDIDRLHDISRTDASLDAYDGLHDRSRLKSCLSALDPDKRHLILMSYVLGYTHGEIAGRLGIPLGTAKTWLRRTLERLKECMS